MSFSEGLFRRPHGAGWIILADSLPGIDAAGLGLSDHASLQGLDGAPLLIVHPGESVSISEAMIAQEGRFDETPLLVSVGEVDAASVEAAAVIVMSGGSIRDWARELRSGVFGEMIQSKIQSGGLILACDSVAAVLGEWWLDLETESAQPAAGWLPGALILPGMEDPGVSPLVRDLMQEYEHMYAVGLGFGSMLALGPAQEVEVWSIKPPSILLAKGWMRE